MIPFAVKVFLLRIYVQVLKFVAWVMPVNMPMIFAGPGSSLQLCATIASSGTQSVLIVTDSMLSKIGLIDPMKEALEKRGVQVTVFDGVEPDPTIEQIETGFQVLQKARCEAVLAVGGGSSIDAAKVIAARATNDKPIRKMTGLFKVRKAILPLYVVPTTAGTGSEVSVGAVVSDPVAKRKLPIIDTTLIPKMACLDGNIYLGVPPPITAATGMDALTHAVESYISRISFAASDQMAIAAVRLIMEYLPRAYENGGEDVEARQQMALAAYYAGIAMSKAGLGYVHAIAHNFGALYHVPHGRANAIVMPHVLDFSKSACADRLADLARVSGLGKDVDSDEVLADLFIAKIREMKAAMDIPEKLDLLQAEDIPHIAQAAKEEARFTYPVPRYMTDRDCKNLISRMLV